MARTMDEVKNLVAAGDTHAFYVTGEWKRKRKEILQRDNNLCQRCLGKFGKRKDGKVLFTRAKYVHHIMPMEKRFDKALDDENLISLCFACHEEVEGRSWDWGKKRKRPLTEEKW